VRSWKQLDSAHVVLWWLPVKLYDFDGIDDRLSLIPLAARRALDHAGLKLSLDAWNNLTLETRRHITRVGSAEKVELNGVVAFIKAATPPPEPVEPSFDPSPAEVPQGVIDGFGEEHPVPLSVWSALPSLERYALAKVAASGKHARVLAAYKELIGHSAASTHIAPKGGVWMVDVSKKEATQRRAVAETVVSMNRDAFERLIQADAPKGDVLGTARLAGIMGAKQASLLVPLCHPVALTHLEVQLDVEDAAHAVRIQAIVEAHDRTGVEMEAMTAASVAALTVYDMLKAFDHSMTIGPTRLLEKSGGRSGDFVR